MQHHALGVDFRCRAVQPKNCAHRRGLLAAFSISSFGGAGVYMSVFPIARPISLLFFQMR